MPRAKGRKGQGITLPYLVFAASATRRKMESVYGSPVGECFRWSMNLLSNLREAGVDYAKIVHGEIVSKAGARCPHSWLQCSAWFVDITADQFNGIDKLKLPPVIVAKPYKLKSHITTRRLTSSLFQ